jgi:transcriptional regulator with XRE-family HTH domain
MQTQTLGNFIREKRDEKDFSLREFAKIIDRSPAFLSDVELSRRNPSQDLLLTIAKELDIKIEELKALDTRIAEDIKAKSKEDPNYVFAFRSMIDSNLSSEEIIKFVKRKKNSKKE